jgi:hypothetical protein
MNEENNGSLEYEAPHSYRIWFISWYFILLFSEFRFWFCSLGWISFFLPDIDWRMQYSWRIGGVHRKLLHNLWVMILIVIPMT